MEDRSLSFYTPVKTDFWIAMNKLCSRTGMFDIFHVHRSGYTEFPIVPECSEWEHDNSRFWKRVVETNIFGNDDPVMNPDVSICISKEVEQRKNIGKNIVIPNGVPYWKPNPANTLRKQLNIADDTFVFGRIGRPANFDPVALDAFESICLDHNCLYLIVNPCEFTRFYVRTHKISKVVFIKELIGDAALQSFFNTIDVLAHYRSDGESCGVNIIEAMAASKPVISHYATAKNGFNAQQELIGTVMMADGIEDYASIMLNFINDTNNCRLNYGSRNYQTFKERCEIGVVTKQIVDVYNNLT
jgi:glycosyltransferase involved in cell wall biosynthesis